MWNALHSRLSELIPIWKLAIATTLAWEIASRFGSTRPYFAVIAVVVSMQMTVEDSIGLGIQRVMGIILGILLADWSERMVGIHAWSIGALVLIATSLATFLRLGRQAVTQISISSMLVWFMGMSHKGYALDRVLDTVIGVAMAVLCDMLILPPDYTPQAEKALREAAHELGEQFIAIGQWLGRGAPQSDAEVMKQQTDAYLARLHAAWKQLDQAVHALRYSPLVQHRRARLKEYQSQFHRVRVGYEHLTGIFRTVCEWRASAAFHASRANQWGHTIQSMGTFLFAWSSHSFTEAHSSLSPTESVRAFVTQPGKGHDAPTSETDFEAALRIDTAQFQRDFMIE